MKRFQPKYPLLTGLMLFQILTILIGSGILLTAYFAMTQARQAATIGRMRQEIMPQLELRQEQWRTWDYMALNEVLSAELKDFQKRLRLDVLAVVSRGDLPKRLSVYDIVIPEEADEMDTVVYARLAPVTTGLTMPLVIILLGLGFVLIVILSGRFIETNIYRPIFKLNNQFIKLKTGEDLNIDAIQAKGEVQKFLAHVREMYRRTRDMEHMAAVGKMASQVAHDIRSPLAALNMAVTHLKDLPEEERLLIRQAVRRIDDIANDLSSKNRRIQESLASANPREAPVKPLSEEKSLQLLSSLIEPLISEKRVQYQDRPELDISFQLDKDAYGLFALVEPGEFKRVLSNLINNAAEAIDGPGKILVDLSGDADSVTLSVSDSGKGMDAKVLSQVTERGVSFGKEGGSGLGLYHAKKRVTSWGGRLDIDSTPGSGTTVSVILPRQKEAPWFVEQISISSRATVVVLDDDQSIHQIWASRLLKLGLASGRILHFTTASAFVDWYQRERAESEYFYLVDFELLGSKETGLELIERYALSEHAVLVTSRYEEEPVQRTCRRLGIKLLPKGLAQFVPLILEKEAGESDCVLIDDDELIHRFWRIEAKANGVRLHCFKTAGEFLHVKDRFAKDVPIYIDVHLGGGVRGEEVGERLSQEGFGRLYLATGGDAAALAGLRWVKGVISKEPPWASR